jgi:hypothetical protein
VPLLREIGTQARQAVGHRRPAPAAKWAARLSGGSVVRRCSPFVIGTARALPPDPARGTVRNLFGPQPRVGRRVPLSHEIGPTAHPIRRPPRSRSPGRIELRVRSSARGRGHRLAPSRSAPLATRRRSRRDRMPWMSDPARRTGRSQLHERAGKHLLRQQPT